MASKRQSIEATLVASSKVGLWVDPEVCPEHGDISSIKGNAPEYIKQLNNNTFHAYGVGNDSRCFGYHVGKSVIFVDVSLKEVPERYNHLEAKTVAEVTVDKRACSVYSRCLLFRA
jgi:acyl-coenzyme A thioesterase 13